MTPEELYQAYLDGMIDWERYQSLLEWLGHGTFNANA